MRFSSGATFLHPAAVRRQSLVSLLLLLLAATSVVLHVAARPQATTCTVPTNKLTFKCDSSCGSTYKPCWYNASLVDTADACKFECYNIYYSDAKQENFVFLVPYGAWKSAQQIASGNLSTDEVKGVTDDKSLYIFKSNDYLSEVDTLVLPTTVNSVSISGGSYLRTNIVKGRVSNVGFANDFITKQSQVQDVYLGNLNLAPTLSTLTTILPLTIETLELNNGLLTTFPTDFSKFTTLQKLSLSNNYITGIASSIVINTISQLTLDNNNLQSFEAYFKNATQIVLSMNSLTEFPPILAQYQRLQNLYLDSNDIPVVEKAHVVESVTKLYLGSNRITKFEAVYPKLIELDLRANYLTAIPTAIFKHKSLTTLNLGGNQLKNIMLTSAQASFFSNLTSLTIDANAVFKDCSVSQQKLVQGIKFCIVEDSSSNEKSTGGDSTSSEGGATNTGGTGEVKASSGVSVGLIIGIVCGSLVFIGIVAFLCVRARQGGKKQDTYQATSHTHGTNGSSGTGITHIWNDAALLSVKVNEGDIEDIKPIGKGAYGDVWLVKYRNARLLASKRLRKGGVSPSTTQNFIDEIKLHAKLEHPKIVQFVGAAWTIEADLQALFEYMEGGDLHGYLNNPMTSRMWTHEKLQIAIDVVESLVYVHSFSPPLVHRDIKSRNVLLSAELEAKLTDFGASRFRSENDTMTAGVGTGKWLAPEVISGSSDYGPAADIFSFGAMLTELDSHKLPYDEVRGSNGNKLVDVALLQMVSTGQVVPSFTASCPEQIVKIGIRCFAFNPANRPNAAEIAYALRQMKKSM